MAPLNTRRPCRDRTTVEAEINVDACVDVKIGRDLIRAGFDDHGAAATVGAEQRDDKPFEVVLGLFRFRHGQRLTMLP
jgi:hypothetical protein